MDISLIVQIVCILTFLYDGVNLIIIIIITINNIIYVNDDGNYIAF